jgi:CelD/BcsL family acetyltransferase involved in cellulose biosynthesis
MWARAGHSAAQAARTASQNGTGTAFDPAQYDTVRAGAYRACMLPARRAECLAPAWRKVAAHALVRDPFHNPLWLAAAARHDSALRDLQLLTLWRGETLCGLFPIIHDNRLLRRSWRMPRLAATASGAPFLLRTEAEAVFAAARSVLFARASTLAIDASPIAAPFIESASAHMTGRHATRAHAILADAARADAVSAGTALRMENPYRTASSRADGLRFRFSGEADFVRAGVEHLLDRDARDAAVTGRTALLRDVGIVNTIRTATRAMAAEKSCRIALLSEGETVHAAAIVLLAHDRAVIWHEAVDPAFADAASELHRRLAGALERLRDAPDLVIPDSDRRNLTTLRVSLAPVAGLPGTADPARLVAREGAGENRRVARRVRQGEDGSADRAGTAQRHPDRDIRRAS